MKGSVRKYERTAEKNVDLLARKLLIKIKDVPGAFGKAAAAIGKSGALLGDIATKSVDSEYLVREVTIFAKSEDMINDTVKRLNKLNGVKVEGVIDEVFEMHKGGKIEVNSTVDLKYLSDLRKAYTPGVALVSKYIQHHPETFYDYTYVGNTVAIVTNGTAVLGLGNIGVKGAMPVMEGKSVLFKKFSGINAVPILIESEKVDDVVNAVKAIHKSFGAIQLEDIKAPECFEIERRLIEALDVPVFHDDQHGTAVVVLAAVMNVVKKTGKDKKRIKTVINGAGAAGIAIGRLLMGWGIKDVVFVDQTGAIYEGRPAGMNPEKAAIAKITNRRLEKGRLDQVIKGKDLFVGVSGPNLVSPAMIRSMAKGRVCLALANPIPEIFPKDALKAGARYALDGRSLNNALAFPGIFKGALLARAKKIDLEMKMAAARAIASCAEGDSLVPSQLDPKVHASVAEAVRKAVK